MFCRLQAATPAWQKSGRLLRLDEQSLSFLSSLAEFWLMLPLARLLPRLCQYFWEQLHLLPKEEETSVMKNCFVSALCPWDGVQASCIAGVLLHPGKGAKEAHKEGLRSCVSVYFWEHQKSCSSAFPWLHLWLSWPECLAHVTVTLFIVSLFQIQSVWHALAIT